MAAHYEDREKRIRNAFTRSLPAYSLHETQAIHAYSRRIVGWSIDSKQDATLVVNALDMAIRLRDGADGLLMGSIVTACRSHRASPRWGHVES